MVTLASTLTGCGGSMSLTAGNTQPIGELGKVQARPPAELTKACASPLKIASGSAGAVERIWARDRAALVMCKERHASLVKFYSERDAGLAGGK